jgi:pyruvate,water dikinase
MLDTTHHGRRPITRFMLAVSYAGDGDGFANLARRYGLPLETMVFEPVNGYVYARPKAVGEPDEPGSPPPRPVLWLLSRLHPELRRRNKAARRAWSGRIWRDEVDDWFDRGGRAEVVAANLQRFDVTGADDTLLAAHVEELAAHLAEQFVAGFETHGGDIIPCGDFLAHCAAWGVAAADATALLAGASPLTRETRDLLEPAARAVAAARASGVAPASVDEVRGLGPDVAQAVDRWLELHGWRLLNSDDVDCPTLIEKPELQLRVLLNLDGGAPSPVPDPTPVRQRIAAEHREAFDRLLAEARYGLRLRDDNVGVRLNWPAGLARRALLEAGRRLARRGAMVDAVHAVHAAPAELASLLRGRGGPSAAELTDRHAEREWQLGLEAPAHIGPEEEPPPLDVFPAPMARATAAVLALIDAMEGAGDQGSASPTDGALTGTGVGDTTYTGRACVLAGPEDDFGRLEPGDVLIAPFTSPSFNSLFPLLGAVAVAEGGVMSHTAIISREFDIPAVVGVGGLLDAVRHGDRVQVDPVAGTVRVLDAAPDG